MTWLEFKAWWKELAWAVLYVGTGCLLPAGCYAVALLLLLSLGVAAAKLISIL